MTLDNENEILKKILKNCDQEISMWRNYFLDSLELSQEVRMRFLSAPAGKYSRIYPEWKSARVELPKEKKRVLGYCVVKMNSAHWTVDHWRGIIDVYFSPDEGWRRCEDPENFCGMKVDFWSEYPGAPEIDDDKK